MVQGEKFLHILSCGYEVHRKSRIYKVISMSTINEIRVQWLPSALTQRRNYHLIIKSLFEFRIMHDKMS